MESDNRLSWSLQALPLYLRRTAENMEIKSHLEYLIEINSGKKVVVFLDNAKIHTSTAMQVT